MSLTLQEHQWGRGACAIRAVPAYPNLGKSISLCFSAQVHFPSNLSRFGVEPRGSSGEMPFVVSCALFTSCRAGMPVTAGTGTWAEAEACLLFPGSYWLCVFPEQSQLCSWAPPLQLAVKLLQLSLAKSCSCSDLPFPLQASWLQNRLWQREKTTINEERKGKTDPVKAILLPAERTI